MRLYQRPSARELLKHKFIRMAKKTSYLTELIERHERWKAEGGERIEEEERNHVEELYVRPVSSHYPPTPYPSPPNENTHVTPPHRIPPNPIRLLACAQQSISSHTDSRLCAFTGMEAPTPRTCGTLAQFVMLPPSDARRPTRCRSPGPR